MGNLANIKKFILAALGKKELTVDEVKSMDQDTITKNKVPAFIVTEVGSIDETAPVVEETTPVEIAPVVEETTPVEIAPVVEETFDDQPTETAEENEFVESVTTATHSANDDELMQLNDVVGQCVAKTFNKQLANLKTVLGDEFVASIDPVQVKNIIHTRIKELKGN